MINEIGVIIAAVIGLATLAVILSKQANTTGVISAASSGLGGIITAAVSPVAGGTTNQNNLFGSAFQPA
jgi:hypothetical protein